MKIIVSYNPKTNTFPVLLHTFLAVPNPLEHLYKWDHPKRSGFVLNQVSQNMKPAKTFFVLVCMPKGRKKVFVKALFSIM